MNHTHSIVDTDKHFVIDAISRKITTQSDDLVLMQGDHNSEIYTFEIPKMIEGHDMSLCNRVEVHYNNISSSKVEKSSDVYTVTDLRVDETDPEKLVFSWLLSGNATKYAGALGFRVRFCCIDDNGVYTYKWHTDVYKGISVSEGLDNAAAVEEDFSDAFSEWEARLEIMEKVIEQGAGGLTAEASTLLIQILKNCVYNADVSEEITDFESHVSDNAAAPKNRVKWCAMGDSITHGYVGNADGTTKISPVDAWASKLSNIKKWDVTNEGVGKTGWLAPGDSGNEAAWNKAAAIDFKKFDVVTLAYGINDWSYNHPLGTIDDVYNTPTTIYGAMRKTIETVIASNPLCKIFVITPLNRMGQYMEDSNGNPVYLKEEDNWALGLSKTKAGSLEDVFNAIKTVCEYYGVEMIDMTHSSIVNRKNVPICLPDNIHPSEETHTAIARELSAKINFI